MISRTLVPKNSLPLHAVRGPACRNSTFLDTRQIVPAELPVVKLHGHSAIPAHVPLEVLAANLVVPRDAGNAPPLAQPSTARLPLTALDERVVIPRGAQPAGLQMVAAPAMRHATVLEPDVLTTGEVNLLARPLEEEAAGWTPGQKWPSTVSSILFHAMLVGLFLLQPRLFPPQPPTSEEIERAQRFLGTLYVPPDLQRALLPPPAPAPQIKVDPRIFKQLAPPEAAYQPPTGPAAGKSSPNPQPEASKGSPVNPAAPPVSEPPRTSRDAPRQPRFEPPRQPEQQRSPFALPNLSAGRALEESLRGAAKNPGGPSGSFGGEIPRGGGGGGGTGSGNALAHGLMELLTPTEGVDFTHYLNRVLASVRRNWYAVIPESARLGEKGIVVLEFRIMKDGSVPAAEPVLVRTSGRTPLDFAASSSIRSSNPFEPLPRAFSGPFIALRFTFLYNLPIEAAR
jgi:hypothetical protein